MKNFLFFLCSLLCVLASDSLNPLENEKLEFKVSPEYGYAVSEALFTRVLEEKQVFEFIVQYFSTTEPSSRLLVLQKTSGTACVEGCDCLRIIFTKVFYNFAEMIRMEEQTLLYVFLGDHKNLSDLMNSVKISIDQDFFAADEKAQTELFVKAFASAVDFSFIGQVLALHLLEDIYSYRFNNIPWVEIIPAPSDYYFFFSGKSLSMNIPKLFKAMFEISLRDLENVAFHKFGPEFSFRLFLMLKTFHQWQAFNNSIDNVDRCDISVFNGLVGFEKWKEAVYEMALFAQILSSPDEAYWMNFFEHVALYHDTQTIFKALLRNICPSKGESYFSYATRVSSQETREKNE